MRLVCEQMLAVFVMQYYIDLMSFICSKILLSKQKIIDLFPKIERKLESIKEADSTVMQMQIKRQREFWHLLKIACVSHMLLMS